MSKQEEQEEIMYKITSITLGFYPGVLFGVRSYIEPNRKIHVLYLPFVSLAWNIRYESPEDAEFYFLDDDEE